MPLGCCHRCGITPSHGEWMGKGLCRDFAPHLRVCSLRAALRQLCARADPCGRLSARLCPGRLSLGILPLQPAPGSGCHHTCEGTRGKELHICG